MSRAPIPAAIALHDLMDARFSCRSYLPDPVPVEIVHEILEIAQASASWANVQPWHATVLAGEETQRFRDALLTSVMARRGGADIPPPERYENEYRDRRRTSGFALYDSLDIAYDDKVGRGRQMLENFRFFGAPNVAVISSEAALGPYGYVDTGAFVSSFLLAATSLGVASIAQAAIAMEAAAVHEHLGIPESRHIVCGISFGYADHEHPANAFRTERAPLREIAELRGF